MKVRGVFFTLGRYDAVTIFEAPNEKSAMKLAMETGFFTEYTAETLIAIPAKEL